MKTVRVVVTRSHRHSLDRIVEVGEVLDLPEATAIERITTGAVKAAPQESAPEAPAVLANVMAAGETGTPGHGVPAGEASASSAVAAEPKASPVADPEQPAAPAEPPASPVLEPQTIMPSLPASESAARGRRNPK